MEVAPLRLLEVSHLLSEPSEEGARTDHPADPADPWCVLRSLTSPRTGSLPVRRSETAASVLPSTGDPRSCAVPALEDLVAATACFRPSATAADPAGPTRPAAGRGRPCLETPLSALAAAVCAAVGVGGAAEARRPSLTDLIRLGTVVSALEKKDSSHRSSATEADPDLDPGPAVSTENCKYTHDGFHGAARKVGKRSAIRKSGDPLLLQQQQSPAVGKRQGGPRRSRRPWRRRTSTGAL